MSVSNCYRRATQAALLACLLWCNSLSCFGEVRVEKKESEDGGTHFTYHMTVTPASVTTPLLKHRLTQRRIDLKPGNAAEHYKRAFQAIENLEAEFEQKFGETGVLFDWLQLPEEELPQDKVRAALEFYRRDVLEPIKLGTSLRNCDWGRNYEDMRGSEAFDFDLGAIGSSREVMRLLGLSARIALQEERFVDAISLLRMKLRLSNDLAQEPLFVCGLFGIASYGVAFDTLIEFIGTKNSPSMLHPLSVLPNPPLSLRKHIKTDLELGYRVFSVLSNPESADWSATEWNRQFILATKEWIELVEQDQLDFDESYSGKQENVVKKLLGPGISILGYRHAKQRLCELGHDQQTVETMPVGQVLAIYTRHAFQKLADEVEVGLNSPFWSQWSFDVESAFSRAHIFSNYKDREIVPIGFYLLTPIKVAKIAEMRVSRDYAALRVIEAIRLHATKTGRLPISLSYIEAASVPPNPATGESFRYRLEYSTGYLELPPEDGLPTSRTFVIRLAQEEKE